MENTKHVYAHRADDEDSRTDLALTLYGDGAASTLTVQITETPRSGFEPSQAMTFALDADAAADLLVGLLDTFGTLLEEYEPTDAEVAAARSGWLAADALGLTGQRMRAALIAARRRGPGNGRYQIPAAILAPAIRRRKEARP